MNSEIIKRSMVLTSLLIACVPLSGHTQVIYGIEHARHFHTHQSAPYYIQVGSFHSAQFANQLKNQLVSRTHYPVRVSIHGQNHTVRIGPLASIAEVRSVETGKSSPIIVKTAHKRINTPVVRLAPSPQRPVAIHQPMKATVQNSHWYVGMNAGIMQTHISKSSMTVPNGSNYPPPLNVDQYSVKRHRPTLIDIQAGHRWERSQQWLPAYALALRYQHVFTKNIQGTVTQYSLPDFVNYNYRWGVGADALSLYSKIDLVKYARFMPYVDLGLGLSIPRSKSYRETALPNVTPRFSPDYAPHRNSQFTYNLGAGLDFILTQNILLSAGYAYQSFGNLSSGLGQGLNWRTEKLNLGKLNTNMGLVGLTYLFDGSFREHHQPYK